VVMDTQEGKALPHLEASTCGGSASSSPESSFSDRSSSPSDEITASDLEALLAHPVAWVSSLHQAVQAPYPQTPSDLTAIIASALERRLIETVPLCRAPRLDSTVDIDGILRVTFGNEAAAPSSSSMIGDIGRAQIRDGVTAAEISELIGYVGGSGANATIPASLCSHCGQDAECTCALMTGHGARGLRPAPGLGAVSMECT